MSCLVDMIMSRVLLLFLILWAVAASAQDTDTPSYTPLNYQFNFIDNKKLNSIGELFSIAQDKYGFMWFGGEKGLARYDGYKFKIYRHNVRVENSLSNNRVSALLVDKFGDLWVATAVGINRYQVSSDNFKRYTLNGEGISNSINCIFEDAKGKLWLGAQIGLLQFDRTADKIRQVDLSEWVQKHAVSNPILPLSVEGIADVRSIAEDAAGYLWLGSSRAGLLRLDVPNSEFISFKHDPEDEMSISSNVVVALNIDHQNTLWVGTFDHGLNKFDIKTQSAQRIRHDPRKPYGLATDKIRSIFEDSQNNLWIGVGDFGLHRLNRVSAIQQNELVFDNYVAVADDEASIRHDKVWPIFEDQSGGLWFGHFPSGVSTVNQYAKAFTNYTHKPIDDNSLSHSAILSIAETSQGNLWVGTESGLNHIDRSNNKISRFSANPVDDPYSAKGLSADAVTALLVDSDQTLWLGTWLGGLSRFYRTGDAETKGKFEHMSEIPGDQVGNAIWRIIEDKKGDIWFATTSGLTHYNKSTKEIKEYKHDHDREESIPTGFIWTVYEASNGDMWVGHNDGASRLDLKSGTFKHFVHDELDSNSIGPGNVFSIYERRAGEFWFGLLGGGVSKLDSNSNAFEHVRADQGLVDEFVVGILQDNDGFLWLSHGDGISRLDVNTKQFRHFNKQHGLPGNVHNRTAYHKTKQGEIAIGGIDGLTIIDTAKIYQNTYIPPAVFTDLSLFNESVDFSQPDAPITQSVVSANKIILEHNQSVISFEFAGLNYRFPELNEYAFKLEGFDENWTYSGKKRTTTYTNLDAGTYHFRIRVANNEGVWNEKGAKIELLVLPPFWQTWWAYTLYCLAVLALISRFLYLQHRKRMLIVEQNRLLELKVAERTRELQAKNESIQSMLGNIRQGLFTVDRSLCIHEDYSRYLEEIFSIKDIAGAEFSEFLFGKALIANDKVNQAVESAQAIIGEAQINFDFNSHLLLREYEISSIKNSHTVKKTIELDWNPIVEGDKVVKLMVTVRDVTKLRELEGEATKKERELDIISQVLAISADKFTAFWSSIEKLMRNNSEIYSAIVLNNNRVKQDQASALYRNYHTIKGNARTLKFSFLSQVSHDIETMLSCLDFAKVDDGSQEKQEPYDNFESIRSLISQNEILRSTLDEYQYVFHDLLHRDYQETGEQNQQGFMFDVGLVDSMIAKLHDGRTIEVQNILLQKQSMTLADVLSSLIDSLPSIAEELGKKTPIIRINCDSYRIKKHSVDLVANCFSHLFRNCLDHGLESPEERKRLGKTAEGSVQINASSSERGRPGLSLRVRDDGRGLNINTLLKKGEALNMWSVDRPPNLTEVAQIIFQSGVSTKETVTDISGRGVGMDAVKQFLLEAGGDISIVLLAPKENSMGFIPFEMLIELPETVYVVCKPS